MREDVEPAADVVAVVGDVGGHVRVLWELLRTLGFRGDPGPRIEGEDWRRVGVDVPSGVHVVQVGDLVHRGPDSLGVVSLVDRLMERGVWTQLVGNHEQLYVARRVFDWPETIPPRAQSLLGEWWTDGRMTAGAVVKTPNEDWLVTHGGLTAGYWEHGLGRPRTPAEVLAALAEAGSDGALWHPGAMLTGRADHSAGPIWAEAGREVYPSWLDADAPLPLSQAHGHSSAYDWDRRRWRADRRIPRLAEADSSRRHVTFTHGTHRIVGIDPGHGVDPAAVQVPLLLERATVHA